MPFNILRGRPAETVTTGPVLTLEKAKKKFEHLCAAWKTCRIAIGLHRDKAKSSQDEIIAAEHENLMVKYMADALSDHADALALASLLVDEYDRLEKAHAIRSGHLLDLEKFDKGIDSFLDDDDRAEIEREKKERG